MSDNTENTVDNTETTVAATTVTALDNIVKFEDGERNFGKKGQIQKEITITDEAITFKLWLVTGVVKTFELVKSNPLFDTFAGRGVIEYIGNAVAGVYQDKEGTHPEDFHLGIETAIANLVAGVLPTRERSSSETKGLGDLIRAYVELRTEALDADGNHRFSDEEASYDTVKALIVGATPDENKARAAQASVKAKIEGYRLERQQAKAAAAQSKVADSLGDLI